MCSENLAAKIKSLLQIKPQYAIIISWELRFVKNIIC